jgi:hypothetical protein
MKKKQILILLLFPLLMPGIAFPLTADAPHIPKRDHKANYETDGHYWTVLLVATMLKLPEPKIMAFSAEYPDNVINADGYCVRTRHTFMYPKAQKKIHALTGGAPEAERQFSLRMILDAVSPHQLGVATHRLADSYAHINDKKGRMYPHLIGHTLHWKEPDKIKNNPAKYLRYVHDLVAVLGGPDAAIDMTAFEYIAKARLNTSSNEAILKAEYNILTNALAFNVDKNELEEVEKYLNERFSGKSTAYAVHSNTDGKWRVTKTIILIQSAYTAQLKEKVQSATVDTTHDDSH